MRAIKPAALRAPAGPYSHGILIDPGKTWLFTTGQVALDKDGNIPDGADAQSALVWRHLVALLAEAGMDVSNIVKTTVHTVSADAMAAHNRIRNEALGHHAPVTTATIVSALANPKYLVEVEIIACK